MDLQHALSSMMKCRGGYKREIHIWGLRAFNQYRNWLQPGLAEWRVWPEKTWLASSGESLSVVWCCFDSARGLTNKQSVAEKISPSKEKCLDQKAEKRKWAPETILVLSRLRQRKLFGGNKMISQSLLGSLQRWSLDARQQAGSPGGYRATCVFSLWRLSHNSQCIGAPG